MKTHIQQLKTIKFKPLLLAMTLISSSLLLQGCTEEEFTDALTVIAVAAIIATEPVQTHDNQRPPPYHLRPENPRCGHDTGYRRDPRCDHGPRVGFPHGNSIQGFSNALTVTDDSEELLTSQTVENNSIENMANRYKISVDSAERLQSALLKAKNKDFTGVDDIGIAQNDLKKLYDGKSLSRYSYVNISAAMRISFEESKQLVKNMQLDIQQAKQLVLK